MACAGLGTKKKANVYTNKYKSVIKTEKKPTPKL